MSISKETRNKIRERADFSCEYCNTSEIESGGELTIDHFHPLSQGGDDDIENLVYCCFRCNVYKGDFWEKEKSRLWNPRKNKFNEHFWFSEKGIFIPLTEIGKLTIKLLRLNRKPLVTKRLQDHQKREEKISLEKSQTVIDLLIFLSKQQKALLKEQQNLLEEQKRLLKILDKT